MSDYDDFLASVGMTDEKVREIMAQDKGIAMPKSAKSFIIKKSEIQGRGYFLLTDVDTDEVIAPALLSGIRTPAGRYMNHSPTPNAEPIIIDDNIYIMAIKHIANNEEVTLNYRQSLEIATQLANSF